MFQYSIIKWVYNLRILPRWVIIIIDLGFIGFSTLIAYLLRFTFEEEEISPSLFFSGISVSLVCGFASIIGSGSYKGIVRYTGLQDGVRIFFMLILNSLFMCGINLLFSQGGGRIRRERAAAFVKGRVCSHCKPGIMDEGSGVQK